MGIITKKLIVMKTKALKLYNYALLILAIISIIVSCKKEENTESELPRLFRPAGVSMNLNKFTLTMSWYAVDGASAYVVQISNDSLLFENIIISDTVFTNIYTKQLGGNMLYSVRIKALGSNKESDFKICGIIRTPTENIFVEKNSYLIDKGTIIVSWSKGKNVTHLLIKAPGFDYRTVELTDNDTLNGFKIVNDLPNNIYTIEIYDNFFKRGYIKIKVDGDYFVSPGDNLQSIIGGAASGSLIYLKPGAYNAGSATININGNITIKGLYPDTIPILFMDDAASNTANMFNIAKTSKINKILFENIDFAGFTMNNPSGGKKIGYLFNQSSECNVDTIMFYNCKIRNLGNTPFRLKDPSVKTISLLSFNNCIIYDIGYASTYALVNNNVATGTISNIEFKNSTIYNFTGSIILHNNNNSNSVILENCTFNEISTSGNATTIRYIIDYGAGYDVTNGIKINNCIFGSTPRDYTGGIRTVNGTNSVTFNNCYYTADYKDDVNALTSYSIKAFVSQYSGNSTDLWVNPLNGDFNFKDKNFSGKSNCGDPRWRN